MLKKGEKRKKIWRAWMYFFKIWLRKMEQGNASLRGSRAKEVLSLFFPFPLKMWDDVFVKETRWERKSLIRRKEGVNPELRRMVNLDLRLSCSRSGDGRRGEDTVKVLALGSWTDRVIALRNRSNWLHTKLSKNCWCSFYINELHYAVDHLFFKYYSALTYYG